jgi:hypothetical protein
MNVNETRALTDGELDQVTGGSFAEPIAQKIKGLWAQTLVAGAAIVGTPLMLNVDEVWTTSKWNRFYLPLGPGLNQRRGRWAPSGAAVIALLTAMSVIALLTAMSVVALARRSTGRAGALRCASSIPDLPWVRLMEWSGRAPAPPASEAGQGRQRQGARHV